MAAAKSSNIGPDFMCVGAQKGGTGWLYEQLRFHPDFWMPPLKELHYFDRQWRSARAAQRKTERLEEAREGASAERDLRFLEKMRKLQGKEEIDFSGYADLFAEKGAQLSGDITPGYSTLEEEVITAIGRNLPGLKVIFIARDPVERAWSHLSMWVRHKAIERFDPADLDQVTRHLARPEVARRSHPAEIVTRWRRHARDFRLYFFDDLKRDAVALRRSILEFLGADPGKSSGALPPGYNAKEKKAKLELTEKTRAHLARLFRGELERCASELGGPAKEWPARYGF